MSCVGKLLSVWRILSDCPNQPNLPRPLKTHIGFSMFPILDTNLWHTYWNLMMKSLKCYMKRTILIEFLYIPHKYNGMCYVRLALLFLLLKRNPGHINKGAKCFLKLSTLYFNFNNVRRIAAKLSWFWITAEAEISCFKHLTN